MGRILFLSLILGAAALAAAALLRPVSDIVDVVDVVGGEGMERPAEPVRLVGRAPVPIPEPGYDLATALAGARTESSLQRLERWAVHAEDARVRRAALARLVEVRGTGARGFLLARVADEAESPKVRAACARLLGRAGTLADLECVLDGPWPQPVRAGAAAGMVDREEDGRAAVRMDTLLRGDDAALRDAVVASLVDARTAWSRRLAVGYVGEADLAPAARVRLARALGAQKVVDALPVLSAVVADASTLPEVRAAAATALGILGLPQARATLARIGPDAPAALRRSATVAEQRLGRRAAERR